MALNVSLLWAPWPVFFAILIVVVVIIIVLTIFERKLHQKVSEKNKEEETYYQRKLGAVKVLKDEEFLSSLDETAKEFFEEKFQISKMKNYSDLVDIFKEKREEKAVRFCEGMEELLYSGEKLNKRKLESLYLMLEEVIGKKAIETVPEIKAAPVKQMTVLTREMNQIKSQVSEKNPKKSEVKDRLDMKRQTNAEKTIKIFDEKNELETRQVVEPNVRTITKETEIKPEILDKRNEVEIKHIIEPARAMVRNKVEIKPALINVKSKLVETKSEAPKSRWWFFSAKKIPVETKKEEVMKKKEEVMKKKEEVMKKKEEVMKKKVVPVNMKLVKYLAEGTKRGFELKLLKGKLIDAGFVVDDVKRAEKYLLEKRANGIRKTEGDTILNKEKKVSKSDLEGKKIIDGFFNQKNGEITSTRKEVKKSEEANEKLAREGRRRKEPKIFENIGSMDNLDRVKRKIEAEKIYLAKEGYEGVKLTK